MIVDKNVNKFLIECYFFKLTSQEKVTVNNLIEEKILTCSGSLAANAKIPRSRRNVKGQSNFCLGHLLTNIIIETIMRTRF